MEVPILILVVSLAIAILSGRLELVPPKWRGGYLLAGGLTLQVYFVAFPPAWMTPENATPIYLGSQVLVGAFLVLNRRVAGIGLVAVGLGLNAVVVAANGAMPVSQTAIEIAGAESLSDPRHVEHGVHLRNEALTPGTRLVPLSDVLPVPPLGKVLSLGDVVIAAGLLRLARASLIRPTESRRPIARAEPAA